MPTMSASIIAQWPEEGVAAPAQQHESCLNYNSTGGQSQFFPFFQTMWCQLFLLLFFFFLFCLRYAKLPIQEGKKRSKGNVLIGWKRPHPSHEPICEVYVLTH